MARLMSPRLSSRGPIQARSRPAQWPQVPRLHDYPVVAPFKHLQGVARRGNLLGLHDYPVVAPFKLFVFGHRDTSPARSPRLSSRGPIQANFARMSAFRSGRLHDYPVVAPFKHHDRWHGRQDHVGVSTTIQSWPHSSLKSIERKVRGQAESPRLSSRGPIQARSSSCSAAIGSVSVSTTIQSWPHSSRPSVRTWPDAFTRSPRLSSRGPIQANSDAGA